MGTVAEKLTYLNGTKSSLKTAINNLGGDITSSTTFRQYANVLNDIYGNLPKVSDTGTNVSLSPTLKGRLGIVPKGNTLQDGEPTPETPVEIQSATGTQKVVVSGKNLLNVPSPYSVTLLQEINCNLKAGTYTISCSGVETTTTSSASLMRFYKNDNTSQNVYFVFANKKATITLADDIVKITIYSGGSYNESVDKTTTFTNLMLESGSTATTYQEYQTPQSQTIRLGNIELNKIGNYEDYIGGTPDNWVLYKKTRKISLNISDMNNSESYPGWKNISIIKEDYPDSQSSLNGLCNITSTNKSPSPIVINTKSTNAIIYLNPNIFALTQTQWKEQYPNLVFELVYGLQEYEPTPITEEPLVSQLNELHYLMSNDDTTNIDVTGNLPMRITASAIKGE